MLSEVLTVTCTCLLPRSVRFVALGRLIKNRTSVFIAHHLASIRQADVIFVVSDAGIVEQGTHDTLMAKNGTYADLYRRQSQKPADRPDATGATPIPLTARAS